MKEPTQLTQPQRKALVDMLVETHYDGIWSRARRQYEAVRDSLKETLIKDWVQKYGVKDSIDNINQLRSKARRAEHDLKEAEEKLQAAGFSIADDGSVSFSRMAPDSMKESLEQRIDRELGTREEVLTRPFEAARLRLLTVATADEAEKIVEPLLNFEVKVK
jgi:hypothetical protein